MNTARSKTLIAIVARLAVIAVVLLPAQSPGHSIVGKRFFPTTFEVDDPSPSDEFSMLGQYRKLRPEEGGETAGEFALSPEYAKTITKDFGVAVGNAYQNLHIEGDGSLKGYGNLEVNAKYRLLQSGDHEAILAIGLSDEIGNTGNRRIGEDFSVISPTVYFGKGAGDLFGQESLFRPLAVAGTIAANFPSRPQIASVNGQTGALGITRNPTTLSWAFSVQYNLMYLQSFVKDIGLSTPLDRMVVVVEFPMETCLNRGCAYETTGTANPGIIWVGKRTELGLAAQVPLNKKSGKGIGCLALFHVFIDDLFPKSIGRPLLQ